MNKDILAHRKETLPLPLSREATAHSVHDMNDEDLVRRFQSGDRDAFRLLVERNQDRVRSLIFYVINRTDVIDDLSQEIFVKVYKGLQTFRFDSKFYTWLYRITINKCRDELRRKRWKRFIPFSSMDMQEDSIVRNGESETIQTDGFSDAVNAALMKLPDSQREIIILKDIEDHTYEEIAEVLEIEMGTVKSRLSRARSALRVILQPYLRDEI